VKEMEGNIDKIVLTEAVYYILLSIYTPMHGYGIMQNVSELSNGRVNLGPGTLYGAINTLLEKKWILPLIEDLNSRKKEYLITDLGKEIVKNEIVRLEELVKNGKKIRGEN
jgi:DNA-binding PadR family transcriptional regulator